MIRIKYGRLYQFFIALAFIQCNEQEISKKILVRNIPKEASIVFHNHNFIYVMDENGDNLTQITFSNSLVLEHVAVSYDRKKIVANYFSEPEKGGLSSKMILIDLEKKETTAIAKKFHMAGNGGVDWDEDGYIYFAGVEELPFPNASSVEQFLANAGANDIYRIKPDGSDLQNLTQTSNKGEADVSVSPDSKTICYMATPTVEAVSRTTELWIRNVGGTNPKLLFTGGQDRVSSVHDPEISPDGNYIVFSQVNNQVDPVFPKDPFANTAHDIQKLQISAQMLSEMLTIPGSISISPDWKGDKILFLEIMDKISPHAGIVVMNSDGSNKRLIRNGSSIGKWIPN